ncbi:MAG: L,D-transpeptidase family protein [Jiangellaceae bacterium]|nr:L,D-transpeptidase family protein [Jiangellaceae bacterium]
MRKLWPTGVALLVFLAGCAGGVEPGAGDTPEPEPTATAHPVLIAPTGEVPFERPVTLRVEHGTLESVTVRTEDDKALDGTIAPDGASWTSAKAPLPGAAYVVQVGAVDEVGDQLPLSGSFTVAAVPDAKRLTLTVQPGGGDVVGVGAPIVVRFDQRVTEPAAVEQAMHVASAPQVVGSWHWLNSTEVHFRPKEFWPAGARVAVALDLNGVRAADGLWGGRAYNWEFTVGQAHVAAVDAAAHAVTVRVDGRRVATWDASLGRPEFATRNGTYIVLAKERTKRMTSCGADITCDKSSPEYYDLEVDFSVRLTWSGTFVHSAPWSEGAQGSANVSHGCINLSAANGKTFFELARYGDVVTVTNSTRGAGDLVARGDPGMVDWNTPWPEFVAGSALGRPMTTDALAG